MRCTPELGLTEFKCLDEFACHVRRDGMIAFEDVLQMGEGEGGLVAVIRRARDQGLQPEAKH